MMRTRQAYFSAIAEEYRSLGDFYISQHRWFEIMGISMIVCGNCIKMKIHSENGRCEVYKVITGDDGYLTVCDMVFINGDSYVDVTTGDVE